MALIADLLAGLAGKDVILLLFGAAVGFAGSRAEAFLERRRHRRALASMLLVELRGFEQSLTMLYHSNEAGRALGDHRWQTFERVKDDLSLFDRETTYLLIEFDGFLETIDRDKRGVQSGTMPEPEGTYRVRANAGFALRLINDIKLGLERAGGRHPRQGPLLRADYPDLPRIPVPSFESLPGNGQPDQPAPERLKADMPAVPKSVPKTKGHSE